MGWPIYPFTIHDSTAGPIAVCARPQAVVALMFDLRTRPLWHHLASGRADLNLKRLLGKRSRVLTHGLTYVSLSRSLHFHSCPRCTTPVAHTRSKIKRFPPLAPNHAYLRIAAPYILPPHWTPQRTKRAGGWEQEHLNTLPEYLPTPRP